VSLESVVYGRVAQPETGVVIGIVIRLLRSPITYGPPANPTSIAPGELAASGLRWEFSSETHRATTRRRAFGANAYTIPARQW